MFIQEFKRLVKSRTTIIILLLLIISAVSYFVSYGEKQIFVNQLANDFSPDLNRTALANYIDSYTGIMQSDKDLKYVKYPDGHVYDAQGKLVY